MAKKEATIDDVIYRQLYGTGSEWYVAGYTTDFKASQLRIVDSIDDLSVVEIGEDAFKDCPTLKEVEIPTTVRVLSNRAFGNCKKLKTVTYFEHKGKYDWKAPMIIMFEGAFSNCSKLKSVSSPYPIRLLNKVFENCTELEEISATVFGDWWGNTFCNCKKLKSLTIDGRNTVIRKTSFVGCNQDLNLIFKYVAEIENPVLDEIKNMNIYVHQRSKLWELSYEGYKVFPLRDAPQ